MFMDHGFEITMIRRWIKKAENSYSSTSTSTSKPNSTGIFVNLTNYDDDDDDDVNVQPKNIFGASFAKADSFSDRNHNHNHDPPVAVISMILIVFAVLTAMLIALAYWNVASFRTTRSKRSWSSFSNDPEELLCVEFSTKSNSAIGGGNTSVVEEESKFELDDNENFTA